MDDKKIMGESEIMGIFIDIVEAVKLLVKKGMIKESRYETIKKKCENYKQVYLANKDEEAIVSYCLEKLRDFFDFLISIYLLRCCWEIGISIKLSSSVH